MILDHLNIRHLHQDTQDRSEDQQQDDRQLSVHGSKVKAVSWKLFPFE